MSLTPAKLEELSLFVVEIYEAIESELLLNMSRIIRQDRDLLLIAEDGTDYEHWRLRQLNKIGGLTKDNIKIIAEHSKRTPETVQKMLESAGLAAVAANEPLLQNALQAGLLEISTAPPALQENLSLISILNTYAKQAIDVLNLVNTTMLQLAQQTYLGVINVTVGKLLGGTITPHQALQQTVSKWVDKGIPALVDKAGRQWSAEAYVSMVSRTMSGKVANEMQFERMDQYKINLIEVSSHAGARPKCEPYQGKVFSKSGTHKKYPSFDTTSYGEIAGLLGINCHHAIYPYVEGLSTKRNEPYNKKENDRVYKESQQQRSIERSIRKAKKELAVMREIGLEKGVDEAKRKLASLQKNMQEFIASTGRTRRPNREAIVTP